MDFKDYYSILGVKKTATAEEIKKAYKKLAQEHHPDKNPGNKAAEEKFKDINEAYQVLSNPEQRAKYDNLGSSYSRFQQSGGRPHDFNWQDWFSSGRQSSGSSDMFDSGGVSDFFQNIFGGKFGKGFSQSSGFQYPPSRGEDYQAEVSITLEEAYNGTSKLLSVDGEKIEVKLKAGISDGQVLKISGKGSPGKRGGNRGDLLIKVLIQVHPKIIRNEDDLEFEVTIDLYKALLGGSSQIASFGGKLKLNIPPGSQPGTIFRLKGQGMPKYSNPALKGDLYVKLQVKLPDNLTKEEIELVKKLKALRSGTV
jgi:curved DNA-binding protein